MRKRDPQARSGIVSGIRWPQPRTSWIPALAAAASFAVSAYTFLVTSRPRR